ncbi:hypothetical protein QTP88_002468 [Uroleucon formosanum]
MSVFLKQAEELDLMGFLLHRKRVCVPSAIVFVSPTTVPPLAAPPPRNAMQSGKKSRVTSMVATEHSDANAHVSCSVYPRGANGHLSNRNKASDETFRHTGAATFGPSSVPPVPPTLHVRKCSESSA